MRELHIDSATAQELLSSIERHIRTDGCRERLSNSCVPLVCSMQRGGQMITHATRANHELELALRDVRAEGMAQGIIVTARDFGADDARIAEILMRELQIDSVAAQELLAAY